MRQGKAEAVVGEGLETAEGPLVRRVVKGNEVTRNSSQPEQANSLEPQEVGTGSDTPEVAVQDTPNSDLERPENSRAEFIEIIRLWNRLPEEVKKSLVTLAQNSVQSR